MARFNGNVTVFRATVPRPGEAAKFDFKEQTAVDKFAVKKWKELGIAPSDLCSDEVFIRRVYLDITGTLPDTKDVLAFVADKDAAKRDKLVDKLLESPEYAYFFANKWADILRVKRRQQPNRAYGTFAFHTWIRESIAADKPYDEFVRDIIVAIGDESKSPPTVWYKELTTPENFVDDVSQVFLGQRLACANCHHHPYEKWSQDDYWGFAAFFGRVGFKAVPTPGVSNQNQQNQKQVLFVRGTGNVQNKRTGQMAPTKAARRRPDDGRDGRGPAGQVRRLDDLAEEPVLREGHREPLLGALLQPGHRGPARRHARDQPAVEPRAARRPGQGPGRAQVQSQGTGEDDLQEPDVSTCGGAERVQQGRQAVVRPLLPEARLQAEVLFRRGGEVDRTARPRSPGCRVSKFAPNRAIMLPDESFASYFLDVTGRPRRIARLRVRRA